MLKQKLKFVRGDDVSYRLFFRQKSGVPVDLTGVRFDLHVVTEGSAEPEIELSTQTGGIEIQENGEVLVHFAHALTQEATWETASYDLQLTDAEDKRKTVMHGTVQLIPDYTRI